MRILHVVPYFYPAWRMGGAPRAVYELAVAQRQQGHDVSVATTDMASPGRVVQSSSFSPEDRVRDLGTYYEVDHRGLRIFYLRSLVGRLLSLAEIYWSPGMCRSLDTIIENSRPDVLHVHEFRTGLSVSAAVAAAKHTVPLFVSTHGSLFPPGDPRWKSGLKKHFDRVFGGRIISRVNAFHAVSSHEAEDIRRLVGGTKEIRILPHGFHSTKAFPSRTEPAFPSILFIGRVYPIKGVETLLEAFSILKHRHLEAALLLLGHAQRGYLRSLRRRFDLVASSEPDWEARQAVYAGHASPSVVAEKLAGASCLVLPSRYEVWGLVILEALSTGCPVVATGVCGCLEHLGDPVGLTVVPPGDPQLLARAISERIENPVEPSFLPSHLTWESVAREMEAFYRSARGW